MIKKPQWHIERSTDHTPDRVVLVLDTGEDHEINHFLDALLLKSHEQETTQLVRLLKSREKWDDKQQAITSWMYIDDLPKLLDLLLELANITDPFIDNKQDNNPMSAPELDIVYDNDESLSAEQLTSLSAESDQVFDYQDLDTEGSENS